MWRFLSQVNYMWKTCGKPVENYVENSLNLAKCFLSQVKFLWKTCGKLGLTGGQEGGERKREGDDGGDDILPLTNSCSNPPHHPFRAIPQKFDRADAFGVMFLKNCNYKY